MERENSKSKKVPSASHCAILHGLPRDVGGAFLFFGELTMKQYRLLWSSISTSRKIRKVEGTKWFRVGCHLVYTWLIPWGDDDGRLRGEALWVLATILPNEDLTIQEIEKSLVEIERVGLISRYSVDGEQFLQISDWEDHQRIRKDRYKSSSYPACQPDDNQVSTSLKPVTNHTGDGDGDDNGVGDGDKGGSGGKEKIAYAEFVFMTSAEHEILSQKFGEDNKNRMIEILDNYKGSSGKKYKSDYRAILSWVVDRFCDEEAKKKTRAGHKQHAGILEWLRRRQEKHDEAR